VRFYKRRTIVRASKEPCFRDRIDVRGWVQEETDAGGVTSFLRGVEQVKITDEMVGMATPPLLTLAQADAQEFMDELWNAGLRPTEGSGSAGSLAATERHLQDMRALVFKDKSP